MPINVAQFFAIMELYTLPLASEELGMLLHKMWKVSGLPMGYYLYKEYSPLMMSFKSSRPITLMCI